VPAEGLTLARFSELLAKELKAAGLVTSPHVVTSVSQSRLHAIAIAGAVRRPQIYAVFSRTTLLDVLAQAEGLSEDASNRAIVRRGELAMRACNGTGNRLSLAWNRLSMAHPCFLAMHEVRDTKGDTPMDEKAKANQPQTSETTAKNQKPPERRNFLKGAATVAAAAAVVPLQPLLGGKKSKAGASVVEFKGGRRARRSFKFRTRAAQAENIDVGLQADNGDAARFTDFSGSYSKASAHDALGVPNVDSVNSLLRALGSGEAADFKEIIVGTPGGGFNSKHNGPQGSLALDLEGLDSHATVIPAAPSVTSAQTAAEEVEHYWSAVLRDVPFTEYGANPQVAQAVADMNNLSFLQNNANSPFPINQFPFPVTPQNLFRGQIVPEDGNVRGPYISQFMLQPTAMGVQALDQRYQTFLPGNVNEFMTSVADYQTVANGGDTGRHLSFDPTLRFVRNGRDLAA
jgi:hypothetical protein